MSAHELKRPLIPIWLDELGLTPGQFRIYCNLWRRARFQTDTCWPSAPLIAKDCKLNRNTVWKHLAKLETMGLLVREKHYRNSNQYRVLKPSSVGLKQAPIQLAQTERRQSDGSERRQLAQPKRHQGIQGKVFKEGVCALHTPDPDTHTQPFSLSLTPDQTSEALKAFSISDQQLVLCREEFSRRKFSFPAQRTFDHFLSEFRDFAAGKLFVANLKTARSAVSAGSGSAAVGLAEPVGWRDAFPDFIHRDKPWAQLDHAAQAHIAKEMAKTVSKPFPFPRKGLKAPESELVPLDAP